MFKEALPSIIIFMAIMWAIWMAISYIWFRMSLVKDTDKYCQHLITSYTSVWDLPSICLKYYNK